MAFILVVEDNPLIAKLVRLGLEHSGYAVLVVNDGNAALLAAHEYRPDLILLDVLLPGASGFVVLEELKADPATEAIPVFMLTGQSDGASILKGLNSGADAYLSKPIDMADLLTRIAAALARPRAAL
jgi:DNA-binding response OmpR family regulator